MVIYLAMCEMDSYVYVLSKKSGIFAPTMPRESPTLAKLMSLSYKTATQAVVPADE